MDFLEQLAQGIDRQHAEFAENILAWLLMNDDNLVVRHEAAFILGQLYKRGEIIGSIAFQTLLESVQRDASVVVRHEAAESLGWFSHPDAIQALKEIAEDPNAEIAVTAKLGLCRLLG